MLNPFREIIVKDPWYPLIDISEINAEAFGLCCDILKIVRTETRTTSVLLYGEAGNGKTHLLGRLREYLKSLPQLHVFVSVRLQTSPHMFWRHLRKSFVESLMRHVENGRTQLELVYLHSLPQTPARHNKREMPLPRFIEKLDEKTGFLQKLDKVLRRFQEPSPQTGILETLCARQGISRNLCKALEHILLKRHVMDAVAWLRGDSLPESVMKKLNLTQDNENFYDQEYQSREIIKELCRLTSPDIPIVLCFDQIEAIQRYPGDTEGVFVFGKAVRSLHDETDNVLLVSCLQSFFLEQLKKAVTEPDYAAIAVHQGTLNPLTADQSLELAKARLDICPGLDEDKKNRILSGFEKELPSFVRTEGRTARQILSYCAELLDSWETGQVKPGVSDEDFLNEEKTRREKQAIQHVAPEKTDEIIRSALPVLSNLMEDWKELDKELPAGVDIVLEKPGSEKVGISLCNEKNMTTLAFRFRALLELLKETDLNDLIIIRHSGLEITPTSKKGKEYLGDLKKQKAKLIKPDNEVLAALDALRTIIADASAGDLANGGRTVDNKTVRDWLRKHLSGPAWDFLARVTGDVEAGSHPKIIGPHREEPFYDSILQHFSQVTVKQYKKFNNLTIPNLNRINIFAGINNSGKTTLLEAVYLLAQQNDIMALIETVKQRTRIVRYDLNPVWLKDQIPEKIFITGNFDNKQTSLSAIKYQDTDDVTNKSFYVISFKIESVFDNIEQESRTHLFENSPRKTSFQGNKILCRAIFSSPFSVHHPETVKQCHKKSIQWKSKNRIISFIRDKIDPGLINIELEDEWNRFLVTHQKFDQSPDLTHFGEGMQRIFYIALQFAYAKNGIVLIDEFENAIHKELLYDFTRFIQELAVEFNTQVFLTSHSKECIDAFIKNDYQLDDISAYALVEKNGNPSCYYYSGQKLNKVTDLMNLDIRGLR